jgi:hypothetical protein
LWLIFAFLAVDAVTFRQSPTDAAEAGMWKLRFESVIFSTKIALVIFIVYAVFNIRSPQSRFWFWWYLASTVLFSVFLSQWLFIHKTKNQTDLLYETRNAQKRFLTMFYTVTAEWALFNFLHLSGLLFYPSELLWLWFRFGVYSHLAAFTFFLICLAFGITLFVVKEWLAAIRQAYKAHRNVPTDKHCTKNQEIGVIP